MVGLRRRLQGGASVAWGKVLFVVVGYVSDLGRRRGATGAAGVASYP